MKVLVISIGGTLPKCKRDNTLYGVLGKGRLWSKETRSLARVGIIRD